MGLNADIRPPDCAARSPHYPVSKFASVIIRDLQVLSVRHEVRNYSVTYRQRLNLLAPEFFFILAHPVYKMLIIQEPNTLQL